MPTVTKQIGRDPVQLTDSPREASISVLTGEIHFADSQAKPTDLSNYDLLRAGKRAQLSDQVNIWAWSADGAKVTIHTW